LIIRRTSGIGGSCSAGEAMAVSGGSTIDATKFIDAANYYEGDAWDFLIHKTPITECLPIVNILPLLVTGSEMDAGGVISNLGTIKSLRGILLCCPGLLSRTFTVDSYQTAGGSVDII
jgi:alcohol dehydrogenase YqhD (iron-dependent ADH family)